MYWYRFETKGIQRWILDPGKLRDVEGGSRLVERITEAAAGQIESAGGAVIQQAAGAVTATFSDRASLERFAGEWPMQFAYAAPGLRLVQAWSDAGGTLEQVFGRLAAARNLQSPEFPEASPWVKRSSRSGRPALHWSKVRSSADRVACIAGSGGQA